MGCGHGTGIYIPENQGVKGKFGTLRRTADGCEQQWNGGEGGIRTLDALPHTHFPGVLLRPLGHLSYMTPASAGRRAGPATSRHTLWLLPLLPSGPGGVHNLTLREGRTGPPWIQPVLLLNAGGNHPLGQFRPPPPNIPPVCSIALTGRGAQFSPSEER